MDQRSDSPMKAVAPSIPTHQQAIVGREGGGLEINQAAAVSAVEDDVVLVKTSAVAVNPVDTKMAAPHLVTAGTIAGSEFSGHVVGIGSKACTAAPISIGDRVCGAVQGLHKLKPNQGAFAEYVEAIDVVLMKVPDYMSMEEAASFGAGIGTIGLALFHSLDVPGYPTKPATTSHDVLVYGGSTASGTMAIQLLRLAGLNPVTTCSPANFDLVKSYGATAVFDYRSPDCIKEIKAATRNSLKYVLDCVSEPDTMEFCYSCVGRSGGQLTTLEPPPKYLTTRAKTVKLDWVLGPSLHGKKIGWPAPMEREANPEMRAFAIRWFTVVQELLDARMLKTHPIRKMEGGLPSLLTTGLELVSKKQVSGQKLVYSLDS